MFGCEIEPTADRLLGHRLTEVAISDPEVVAASGLAVHRGLARADDGSVAGALLALTASQLAQADAYEVAAYARRRVRTADNGAAWAYVDARPLAVAQRIGIVGDSIAYGRADPAGGWVHRLARAHIGADETVNRVFSLAVPGLMAAQLQEFALDEALHRRCDTVIVTAGVNDLTAGAGPAEVCAALAAACEALEAGGVRPVVLCPLWHDRERARTEFGAELDPARTSALRAELLDWGAGTHRDVIDLYPVLEARSDLLADGLHPTPEGHRLLWEALAERAL